MELKVAILLLFTSCFVTGADEKESTRLKESYDVLKDVIGNDEKGISKDLLNKAECVLVFPSVKKAAFLVGGTYGRGLITCRSGAGFDGSWTAPAMYAMEGASFGFQVGGESTDFVLLVMNEKGANSVLSGKMKMGADASIAAGPVGRTASAETNATLQAEILSWSRSSGAFGGVSLSGSTLRSDDDANKNVYGKKLNAKQIVRENAVQPTPEGMKIVDLLQMASPKHGATGESERIAK
jgi:lipid-binding SYLF domain-containing protein